MSYPALPPEYAACAGLYENYIVKAEQCSIALNEAVQGIIPHETAKQICDERNAAYQEYRQCVLALQPEAPPKACLIAAMVPIPVLLGFLRVIRASMPKWFVSGYYGLSAFLL